MNNFLIDWENSLPEPFKTYVARLHMVADPSSHVRDAIFWKETAMALAARISELEQEQSDA